VAIDPFDSNHAMYGTGATIWETQDLTNVDANPRQMTHWTVGADGIEETSVGPLISPPTGAHLFSGVGDVSGFRHDDFKVSPPGGMLVPVITATGMDFAENNPNVIARVGWANNAGAWSADGGINWSLFMSAPLGVSGGPGTVAVSADGSRFVWAPSNGTAAWSIDNGASWTPSIGLPANDPVISDRVNPLKFYGFDGNSGTLFVSTDGGVTFVAAATGLPGGQLRATTFAEGDLWLAAGNGLYHSTNAGASFTNNGTVQQADAVGFGMAAPHQKYPTIYISGHVNNMIAIFRSTDAGATWAQINDDRHQWGWIGTVIGDPRVFGRVYLGTNGRGIVFGDVALDGDK
jgi:hypothetical protein